MKKVPAGSIPEIKNGSDAVNNASLQAISDIPLYNFFFTHFICKGCTRSYLEAH